ncbi:MAG: hypothetical protein P1V51_04025 [Deltaproteobacteria bacterium]|nr:hypothetical protein [Deltaproteobacteria bacterium]
MRALRLVLAALSIHLVVACGESVPPLRPDGGDGGSADGGEGDGGVPPPAWPQALATLPGASEPTLTRAPDGTLTLTFVRDGKLWLQRPALGGTPVELGAASGFQLEVFAATHPTEDRLFVVWGDGHAVIVTDGIPEGPAFRPFLNQFGNGASPRGAGWLRHRPVVFGQTGETWVGSEVYPAEGFAFAVPIDFPQYLPLPEPHPEGVLDPFWNGYHYYEEAFLPHDLGNGELLVFFPHARNTAADPTGSPTLARWRYLHPDTSQTAARSFYLVGTGGEFELPEPGAAWIQLWKLDGDRWALTWGSSTTSLVFDVHIAPVTLDENGAPVLGSTYYNVSSTPGMTQNSDHAIVRPVGDGRVWLAWRETGYGPRAALLDAQLRPTAIYAPAVDFPCNLSSSMGAQVDADGALHLVAGLLPADQLEVRYWRLELP